MTLISPGDVPLADLRSSAVQRIKTRALNDLAPTDWRVLQFVEDNTQTIPPAVLTARAAIRTKALQDVATAQAASAQALCDFINGFNQNG